MKEKFYFYCENCGTVHEANVFYEQSADDDNIDFFAVEGIYNCNCGHDAVKIDENLIDAVVRLNKLGFTTDYCCEGHEFGEAYIQFKTDVELSSIPEGWVLDTGKKGDIVYKDSNVTYFYTPCIRPIYNLLIEEACGNNFKTYQELYLKYLYLWIDDLEKANNDSMSVIDRIKKVVTEGSFPGFCKIYKQPNISIK